MENVLRSTFAGLLLITGFYLMTSIVYDEGGFGVQLVVKPQPDLSILVGGGEDGAWQRDHPSESKPWWLVNNFIPLVVDDWEGGHPWWEEAYISGFSGTPFSVGWSSEEFMFSAISDVGAFRHEHTPRRAGRLRTR